MTDSANFEGEIFGLQDSPTVGSFPRAALAGGNVYCSTDVCYASGSNLGVNSTLKVGKLPAGAVPLFSIVYPVDTATYGAPDAMSNTVQGTLGISGNTDLLGDVGSLDSATPQWIAPKPDGSDYVINDDDGDTFDVALDGEVDVFLTTSNAELTAGEGVAVKIFYTVAG